MVKIREAIVVEGRYDKNALRQIVDAPIFETSGFGIMNDKTLLQFLRRVAEKRGLIILTDSDGAGFVIRNYLKGALPKEKVLHAYVPDIYGKERRKAKAGKEGKIGVEGMSPEVLLQALRDAGATINETPPQPKTPITKYDLFRCGLSGGPDSAKLRKQLLAKLHLPEHMSTNALLQALNVLYDRAEWEKLYSERIDD